MALRQLHRDRPRAASATRRRTRRSPGHARDSRASFDGTASLRSRRLDRVVLVELRRRFTGGLRRDGELHLRACGHLHRHADGHRQPRRRRTACRTSSRCRTRPSSRRTRSRRTVSSGWGSADTRWRVRGGVGRDERLDPVGFGAGVISLTATPSGKGFYLPSVSVLNTDSLVDVSTSAAPAGGTFGQVAYITARRVNANTEYRVRLRFVPGGAVKLSFVKTVGNDHRGGDRQARSPCRASPTRRTRSSGSAST